MALSNGAYCYNFKSVFLFTLHIIIGVSFMFSHMCHVFVPQNLYGSLWFERIPQVTCEFIEHITHSEQKVFFNTPHNHAFIRK